MAKSAISTCLAVLTCICVGAVAHAQSLERVVAGGAIEWEEPDGEREGERELSYDRLMLAAPPLRWDNRPDRRWWATIVVDAIVAAGLLASDRVAPATEATESFLRRLELSLDVPFVMARPDDRWRLRLRLKVKRARPTAGVVLSW